MEIGRPRRLGLQKINWGDEPVIIAGCEIGKIVRAANSFNWLLPDAWTGIGMPIYEAKKVILKAKATVVGVKPVKNQRKKQ